MDWTHVVVAIVTSLLSAGFVTALLAGYAKILKTRHDSKREDQVGETGVLQQTLTETRRDRDECHREVRRLRDRLTTALVRIGRLESKAGLISTEEPDSDKTDTGVG